MRALAFAVSLCFSSAVVAQLPAPPQGPPPAKGAAGSVLKYEELPSGRILYHEQSGGIVSPIPPPVSGSRRELLPAYGSVKKPEAPTAVVTRKPSGAPALAAGTPPGRPAVARATAWAERADKAIAARDDAAMIALAADPEAKFECANVDRAWEIAQAQAGAGNLDRATAILAPLATDCADDRVRVTVLERSRSVVARATLADWMAREAPAARSAEANRRYERLAYSLALDANAAFQGSAADRARSLAETAGPSIVAFRDAPVATGLGWLWLEGGDAASATLWFGRANTWAPENLDARRGLAYAALRERRFDEALAIADALPQGTEDRLKIAREAHLGRADRAHGYERFPEALEAYAAAERIAPLPRYAQSLQAWSLVRSGRKDEAAEKFAALYRDAPDRQSAEGLLAAVEVRSMLDAGLAASEPLATMLRAERAVTAFNARRFLEAGALDPDRYAQAGAVGAIQGSAMLARREKTGAEGLSKLSVHGAVVVEAGAKVGDTMALRARALRAKLEAGIPVATSLVGSAPVGAPAAAFGETRATVEDRRLSLRWEDGFAVSANAGAVSSDSGLSSRMVGGVELEATPQWGQAAASVAREPVRETVLSHAGMRDPYTQSMWGGVSRDTLAARALFLKASPWSVGASARLSRVEGTQVASNRHQVAEMSTGYDLALPGFSYAAASVAVSGERYSRNLGQFTVGHGGYFSPQMYRRLGGAFDFMTAEDRPWLVRGRVSMGLINKREDDAPVLPLAPDGRIYPGNKSQGHDASGQVAVVARVNAYLQVAAGVSRGISPQYGETLAFFQVRVLFEPRRSVVSADLPIPRID